MVFVMLVGVLRRRLRRQWRHDARRDLDLRRARDRRAPTRLGSPSSRRSRPRRRRTRCIGRSSGKLARGRARREHRSRPRPTRTARRCRPDAQRALAIRPTSGVDVAVALNETRPALYAARSTPLPGQWDLSSICRATARACSVRSNRIVAASREITMTEALDLSHLRAAQPATARAHVDLAVEGVVCAGCIREIERGLEAPAGVTKARVNFTRAVSLSTGATARSSRRRSSRLERSAIAAHPFEPARAETAEARRRAGCCAVSRSPASRR